MLRFSCVRGCLTIRGNIYAPDTVGKHPAVILSHGFLANRRMCNGYAQVLAELGYVAVTYDFCGGGIVCGSDGSTQDMTVLTEKEDLLAVMAYVRTLPYVEERRVSLIGCSQGGYVSAMVAAEHPAEVEKLVLFYPALCIPDDARRGKMMFYRFDTANIPDLLGRFPMRLGGDYARTVINEDPFRQITGYTGPVLILHGTADKVVDPEYSRKAAGCYPDCRLEIIEGGTHVFHGKRDKQAIAILKEFMA